MTDHRAEALALIDGAAQTIHDVENRGDMPAVEFIGALQVAGVSAAIASAKALIHLGDQMRLSNLLATGVPEFGWQLGEDIADLIRHEIGRLVDPAVAEARAIEETVQMRADLQRQNDLVVELRRQLTVAHRRLGETA